MLSYQHLYHAGNAADVHKHAGLAWVLDYLVQKDKPVSYIETHAGRGLYDLTAEESVKTGEAQAGVAVLERRFSASHPYVQRLADVRASHGPSAYPGSPMIAAFGLRETDTLHLAELHPQEHAALEASLAPWGAHVHRADGFAKALALTPPMPRRGLLLVDPSYEVKEDYAALPGFFASVARKWNVGILMLWYPILTSAVHRPMLEALERQFPDGMRHEVTFAAARPGHGMIGSGLFVVNPPWGMAEAMTEIGAVFR